MSDIVQYPLEDGFETSLAQSWDGQIGTVTLNKSPNFTFPASTTTYIVVDPGKTNIQIAEIDSYNAGANTINVTNITLDKGAGLASTAVNHSVGAKVIISDNYQFWKDIVDAVNGKIDKGDGLHAVYADPTARDAAITSPTNGMEVYVTSLGLFTDYIAGAWTNRATGSTVNADVDVAGKLQLDDDAAFTAGTDVGASGANNSATLSQLKKSISLRNTATEIASTDNFVIDNSGENKKITKANVKASLGIKFGGDGSDGAISGAETITGSNDTYIVKNYTTFTPGANTIDVTPTNCIVHIKVSGDCDLTDTTIDFSGSGATAGTGGAVNVDLEGDPGTDGSDGLTNQNIYLPEGGNFGAGGEPGSQNDGGAASTIPFIIKETFLQSLKAISICAGAGGAGGGAGNDVHSGSAGAGGNGGAGGGAIILEVGGDLTFSTTTVDCSGDDGVNGVAGSVGGNQGGGGAGGGGGGGIFLCFYNGTLTGSTTPDVTGGTGGTGGANIGASNDEGGGGGSGGASGGGNSTAGGNSATSNKGGNGGAGANGLSTIEKNTAFS